jgi:hypothetical protein
MGLSLTEAVRASMQQWLRTFFTEVVVQRPMVGEGGFRTAFLYVRLMEIPEEGSFVCLSSSFQLARTLGNWM